MGDLAALRLVAITDLALCDGDALVAVVTAMAAAVPRGALAVQLRAKQLDGRALWVRSRALRAIAGVTLVVNDRLDVARAVGADGVHLPETGLPAAVARALAPAMAIGVSRHAAAAHPDADLVQLGPIWATPSKAGLGAPLGLAALTAQRAHDPVRSGRSVDKPAPIGASPDGSPTRYARLPGPTVVAVGGIDGPARAEAAAAAGADAVAAIRALWLADDPAVAARTLVAAVDRGRAARE